MNPSINDFIAEIEKKYFRTNDDVGSNGHAMLIWNQVRKYAGLKEITPRDLPAFCHKCQNYHIIDSACFYTREQMIETLVQRDIGIIQADMENGDVHFLSTVLRGNFTPYNDMSDGEITAEFNKHKANKVN